MASLAGLDIHEVNLTIRFVQGYRYLDRCGEALVRLESELGPNWIPNEPKPSGGAIKNAVLGMAAEFNSSSMTVTHSELEKWDEFFGPACSIYELLWKTFGIAEINAPVLRVVLQKGFEEPDQADEYVRTFGAVEPKPGLLAALGGDNTILNFTLVNESKQNWADAPVHVRSRLNVSSVRQKRREAFDKRLMTRVRLLPKQQREAIQALRALKRQRLDIPPAAAQFDLERTFESEFSTKLFDLPAFLTDSWQWASDAASGVMALRCR